MSATTPNGWPVLSPGDDALYTWVIPGTHRRMTLRAGRVGFILVHFFLFWNDVIERLDGPGNDPVDEGGHNKRKVTGGNTWSEHSGGAAGDVNWNKHPYGVPAYKNLTRRQRDAIHGRLKWMNRVAGNKIVIWGGDWPSHPGSRAKPDPMHTEVHRDLKAIQRLSRFLARTPRGKRILQANPSQAKVVKS